MMRVLIQYAGGRKDLRDIPDGSIFVTLATVLWDERTQGAIPLTMLSAYEAEKAQELAEAAAALIARQIERQTLITRIETYDEDLATGNERKQFLKDCRKVLLFNLKGGL